MHMHYRCVLSKCTSRIQRTNNYLNKTGHVSNAINLVISGESVLDFLKSKNLSKLSLSVYVRFKRFRDVFNQEILYSL